MPKTSVVIAHVPYSEEAEKNLDICLSSIRAQYDELILVVNDGIGYGKSFNRGFKYATGDYIFLISNDTVLVEGKLSQLLVPNAIGVPVVNEGGTQFGCFACVPRNVYESVGLFDERFTGAYFEDDDLLRRWNNAGIGLTRVSDVRILHEGGATVKAIMNEGELMAKNRKLFDEKWSQ